MISWWFLKIYYYIIITTNLLLILFCIKQWKRTVQWDNQRTDRTICEGEAIKHIDQVILLHSRHNKEQLLPIVVIFYDNGKGVGLCVGRPGTTSYLHGRLTAAAWWCQAGSTLRAAAVSCPSSTLMAVPLYVINPTWLLVACRCQFKVLFLQL